MVRKLLTYLFAALFLFSEWRKENRCDGFTADDPDWFESGWRGVTSG